MEQLDLSVERLQYINKDEHSLRRSIASSLIGIFLSLILLSIGIGIGYIYSSHVNIENERKESSIITTPTKESGLQVPSLTPTMSSIPAPTFDPLSSWLTYTNKLYGYSFKYPSQWKLDISDEAYNDAQSPKGSSPSSFIRVSSPEGYMFTFGYRQPELSEGDNWYSRYNGLTIDGQSFIERYDNQSCKILPEDSPKTSLSSCISGFTVITFILGDAPLSPTPYSSMQETSLETQWLGNNLSINFYIPNTQEPGNYVENKINFDEQSFSRIQELASDFARTIKLPNR